MIYEINFNNLCINKIHFLNDLKQKESSFILTRWYNYETLI